MRKIISFMHLSLDGFVAGPNGEMNRIKIHAVVGVFFHRSHKLNHYLSAKEF